MAYAIESQVASSAITTSADEFYNFFKNNITDAVKIFPATFTGTEVVEGEEGTAGSVILWSYTLEGIPMSAKVRTEEVDDDEKMIKFAVIEGDVLELYKSFGATLDVSEGSAKWFIEFEKSSLLTPPPDVYATVAATLCTLVDDHLLMIN